MNDTRWRFIVGFAAALAVAVLLNLEPYLWKKVFPTKDGYTLFGFPFVFHRQGGFGVYEFRYWAVLVDAALALMGAFEVAHCCLRIPRGK